MISNVVFIANFNRKLLMWTHIIQRSIVDANMNNFYLLKFSKIFSFFSFLLFFFLYQISGWWVVEASITLTKIQAWEQRLARVACRHQGLGKTTCSEIWQRKEKKKKMKGKKFWKLKKEEVKIIHVNASYICISIFRSKLTNRIILTNRQKV